MGISEMQRQFNAYGSGDLPEGELRRFIRAAVSSEPQLSEAFVALTDAYRRANLIDANLQSIIHDDIAEMSDPNAGLTMIRAPGFAGRQSGWTPPVRAANSTDVNFPANGLTSPMEPMAPLAPMARSGARKSAGPKSSANNTAVTASEEQSWRPPPSAPSPPSSPQGASQNTGSTGGSTWDVDASLSEVSTPLYPGAVIRDRFVLVEELGRGGMGVVYKAYDRSRGDVKDRYVAIKVLNEEFKRHPLAVRSLQREARKAQRLAHPNVVGVHDFDRDAGNVYMVMEFLSGRSLEQVLREDGRGGIPLVPAMDIIKCLGAALSYAHEQDIVHCDFKPSNAFLSSDGKVKVLDFGIARAAPSLLEKGDATLFDAGQLGAISPAYASLEMLQRETPDVRDDVYALACVIYELLTGVHPYQRIDAIKAYQTGLQPRPIRKLSRAQWRALKQGLEFQRSARSPSIDALVRPLVTPPSRVMVWIGAAAACLLTVAVAAGVVWKWSDVRRVAAGIHIPFKTQTAKPLQAQISSPASADSAGPTASDSSQSAPAATADATVPALQQSGDAESISRELEAIISNPEPTQQWAAKVHNLLLQYGPVDARARHAAQVAVQVFVAAASDARGRKEYDRAAALLATARSFDEHASELVSESVALERDRAVKGDLLAKADPMAKADPVARVDPVAMEQKRAGAEILKEQFETQAAAGDVMEASATAVSLSRALPGSNYVTRDVPQMLAASYLHRAKTEFAGGKVNESLQTLAESRRKFGRSTDLKDLEERYVRAADVYDRLGSAVVLSVPDTMRMIEDLKSTEGGEFEIAAQMLAQTLADRIADQRAAGREAVADKLLEAGKQIFPNLHGILTRGTAGVLSNTPIEVKDN